MNALAALYRRSFAFRASTGFIGTGLLLCVLGLFTANSHLYIPHFDDAIRSQVQSLASPMLTSTLRLATRLGSTVGLSILGAIVVAVFLYMRRLKYIGLLLLAMTGQGVLQYGIKALFERQRPQPVLDYVVGDTPSFPSGHALASVCFFGLLAYFISLELHSSVARFGVWAAALIVILIVGFSRIYFDVHYPSDVLAGLLAGSIWASSVATGLR